MTTITERAMKLNSNPNLSTDEEKCIARLAYISGATEQDPISRAEQKKIDIEKACEALYIIQDQLNADLMDIEKAKQIMRKAMEE